MAPSGKWCGVVYLSLIPLSLGPRVLSGNLKAPLDPLYVMVIMSVVESGVEIDAALDAGHPKAEMRLDHISGRKRGPHIAVKSYFGTDSERSRASNDHAIRPAVHSMQDRWRGHHDRPVLLPREERLALTLTGAVTQFAS